MSEKSSNVVWHAPTVSTADRAARYGHKGAVLWFTGLSGSGKSTLAHEVEAALFKRGCHTYVLDGDNVRHGLNSDLGFSSGDREENIRRIGEVAKLMSEAGLIVLVCFISPYRADRDRARGLVDEGSFFEILVDCPLSVCEERDPKGLYVKARAGEISDFTGISAPYEAPEKPELTVDTSVAELQECAVMVVDCLEKAGVVGG